MKTTALNAFRRAALLLPFAGLLAAGTAIAANKSGTTLAGYTTIDVCSVDNATWRYSGVVAVWNEGTVDTLGLAIADNIQTVIGKSWKNTYNAPITLIPSVIPAGTTQQTALTYPYSYIGAPLLTGIRNDALITILNHSSALGVPKGPEPKATYLGNAQPCPAPAGCVYTQGYWGNKPNVIWPDPYNRIDTFFLSNQTWQGVMDTPVSASQGYYQLAHQYIAAVLNKASNAPVPVGIQITLDQALTWLIQYGPGACTAHGSCGLQKDWAATLDLYNNGIYPGGPSHCE